MIEEDNLYVNDGQYFTVTEPTDQTEDKEREQMDVIASVPLLNDIVARLTDKIEFYSSVKAIPDEVKTIPEEFMHTVAAYDIVVRNLEVERDYIEGLIREYVKKLG